MKRYEVTPFEDDTDAGAADRTDTCRAPDPCHSGLDGPVRDYTRNETPMGTPAIDRGSRRSLAPLSLAGLLALHGCGTNGAPAGDDFFDQPGSTDSETDTDAGSDTDTGTAPWPEGAAYADEVVKAPGATGEGFGDPWRAVNGVRGAGRFAGGMDVFSLYFEDGVDNYIVLAWSGRRFFDGPGADLAVFENPFEYQSGGVFMDQVIVEVSADGESWVAFPHTYLNEDQNVYSDDPSLWPGFAGITPVLLHEEDNPVDPFDPGLAGGDHFDLADLPADHPATQQILESGGRYVRLVTAPSRLNPATGEPYVHDPVANGADIDGIYARYLSAR